MNEAIEHEIVQETSRAIGQEIKTFLTSKTTISDHSVEQNLKNMLVEISSWHKYTDDRTAGMARSDVDLTHNPPCSTGSER